MNFALQLHVYFEVNKTLANFEQSLLFPHLLMNSLGDLTDINPMDLDYKPE